jgi:hypothetical protein
MLPPDLELPTKQTKEWPLIPADIYQTEITNIEYKTEQNRYKEREKDPVKKAKMPDEKQVMNVEFTIIEDGEWYGRKLWQKMTPMKPYPPQVKGKESWVYRLASAMEGHPIESSEADYFTAQNINDYIHGQVRVTVKHSAPDANGKVWNNVDSFLSAKKQLPAFDPAKVPTENQPAEAKGSDNQASGYDKFKARGQSFAPAEKTTEEDEEYVSPDVAELAEQMQSDDVNVDDIPF